MQNRRTFRFLISCFSLRISHFFVNKHYNVLRQKHSPPVKTGGVTNNHIGSYFNFIFIVAKIVLLV